MSKREYETNLWSEREEIQIPDSMLDAIGGHPLVARTLVRRGIQDAKAARAFLDPRFYQPTASIELPGMTTAADRLQQALHNRETIFIWGDFDVDGQTATTLLVSGLRELGGQVTYHIPVRARESHGVSLPVLKQVLEQPDGQRTSVLLTCDTGISAHESIAYAQEMGVAVLVSDHHDLPPNLPPADAIVNPKLLPAGHPLSTLPGVGVAYKLIETLYDRAGRSADLETFLDLVALGIVADLAVLHADTRYLLQHGLEHLRHTRRLGLRAMLELVELDSARLTEEHIGFILAPRLNALGRLSDANPAVEFLMTQDIARARILSLELEGLNARRKLLTDQVYKAALAQVERDPQLVETAALVLSHPEWPAGVLGIVASRLVERFHKPVILLSGPAGGIARGSARSIEGVDITAAIGEQSDLLAGFGGHPMAAGLSLEAQRIPAFRRDLSRTVDKMLGQAPARPPLQVDGQLELAELTMELVADLERLAPFGPGNPPLILTSHRLRAISQATVGKEGDHMLVTVEDEAGAARRVIWWGGGAEQVPEGLFDLAYTVRSSSYRGEAEIQVEWVDTRLVAGQPPEVAAWQTPAEIFDYRQEITPFAALQPWLDEPGVQIWGEAQKDEQTASLNRYELSRCETLVIWTIPPGPLELQAALKSTSPAKLILFAVSPGTDKLQPFLQRLAGLVKFAIKSAQGQVSIQSLAAATAQRTAAVRAGLAWMQAAGHIRIMHHEHDTAWLGNGQGIPADGLPKATRHLKSALEETAAYRAFYSRAEVNAIIAI